MAIDWSGSVPRIVYEFRERAHQLRVGFYLVAVSALAWPAMLLLMMFAAPTPAGGMGEEHVRVSLLMYMLIYLAGAIGWWILTVGHHQRARFSAEFVVRWGVRMASLATVVFAGLWIGDELGIIYHYPPIAFVFAIIAWCLTLGIGAVAVHDLGRHMGSAGLSHPAKLAPTVWLTAILVLMGAFHAIESLFYFVLPIPVYSVLERLPELLLLLVVVLTVRLVLKLRRLFGDINDLVRKASSERD